MVDNVTVSYTGGHIAPRRNKYPSIAEQIDKLYHDIDDGKFGDDAKTGEFYLAIKAIKDAHPKP